MAFYDQNKNTNQWETVCVAPLATHSLKHRQSEVETDFPTPKLRQIENTKHVISLKIKSRQCKFKNSLVPKRSQSECEKTVQR